MASEKAKLTASSSGATAEPEAALDVSIVTDKDLAAALPLLASCYNEGGETAVRLSTVSSDSLGETFCPLFLHNIYAGLVPPFSSFFLAILNHYQIHALHLHPSSTFLLSIFAFYCEAFIGVMPSIALFRHFFYLRTSPDQCSGCVNFIAVHPGNGISKSKKKVEEFWRKWVFADAKRSRRWLALPDMPRRSKLGGLTRSSTILGRSSC
jgi:hypothetical protein